MFCFLQINSPLFQSQNFLWSYDFAEKPRFMLWGILDHQNRWTVFYHWFSYSIHHRIMILEASWRASYGCTKTAVLLPTMLSWSPVLFQVRCSPLENTSNYHEGWKLQALRCGAAESREGSSLDSDVHWYDLRMFVSSILIFIFFLALSRF